MKKKEYAQLFREAVQKAAKQMGDKFKLIEWHNWKVRKGLD